MLLRSYCSRRGWLAKATATGATPKPIVVRSRSIAPSTPSTSKRGNSVVGAAAQ